MKTQCPNPECKKVYQFDDSKIPEAGIFVKCTNCNILFSINKSSGICPKCSHNRKTNDLECSKCGIIYEKYKDNLDTKKEKEPKFQETFNWEATNEKEYRDFKMKWEAAIEKVYRDFKLKWKPAIEKAYGDFKPKWEAAIEKSNRDIKENNEIRKKASEKASEKAKQRDYTELILMRDMNDSQKMVFQSEMNKVRLNRTTGFLLNLFLGGFGAHHFYMRKVGLGVIYALFIWTFIPCFIALIELFFIMKKIDAYNDEKAKEMAAKVLNTIK
ncbi:MAG: NINE protein [Deltaproteobacteria bacterium]